VSEVAFDELLRRLVDAQVEFILVGGLAVNAWGVVRGTRDVDIVASPDVDNLNRLATLAASLGGRVQRTDALAASASSIGALLADGERVLIETELGPLDVVQGLPGVPSFATLDARAVTIRLGGAQVKVCAREDLLAMKKAAGRTRDLADLEDLGALDE
jgi:predicted nucleotidyltransferase